jgi:hypothetical protein
MPESQVVRPVLKLMKVVMSNGSTLQMRTPALKTRAYLATQVNAISQADQCSGAPVECHDETQQTWMLLNIVVCFSAIELNSFSPGLRASSKQQQQCHWGTGKGSLFH